MSKGMAVQCLIKWRKTRQSRKLKSTIEMSKPICLSLSVKSMMIYAKSHFWAPVMRLCHPPDGSTRPKYKLLFFITTKFFCKEKNALAFNRDRCCHLVLCLRLIPFHSLESFTLVSYLKARLRWQCLTGKTTLAYTKISKNFCL
jgi:hypothetical protein